MPEFYRKLESDDRTIGWNILQRKTSEVNELKLRSNPASAQDAPSGDGFEDGKQARNHQNQAP